MVTDGAALIWSLRSRPYMVTDGAALIWSLMETPLYGH